MKRVTIAVISFGLLAGPLLAGASPITLLLYHGDVMQSALESLRVGDTSVESSPLEGPITGYLELSGSLAANNLSVFAEKFTFFGNSYSNEINDFATFYSGGAEFLGPGLATLQLTTSPSGAISGAGSKTCQQMVFSSPSATTCLFAPRPQDSRIATLIR